MKKITPPLVLSFFSVLIFSQYAVSEQESSQYTLETGHPSLQEWRLPEPIYPEDNKPTNARIALGKKLFFEPRLSVNHQVSCASCHQPEQGWSDGVSAAQGLDGKALSRATPTIINVAYNEVQMWDGRFATLEEQVLGPMLSPVEMNADLDSVIEWLKTNPDYQAAFALAYPDEPISANTLSKAVAAFERTILIRDSRFDLWVGGDTEALTEQEKRGFSIFVDEQMGNCASCHSPPHFSDSGFHNIGLNSQDVGRFKVKPVKLMKGAFKTPTLRGIASTAPYFHNGEAETLAATIQHYVDVNPDQKTNISPTLTKISLSDNEQADLLAFLKSLSAP